MTKILFYISSLNRGGAERVLLSVIEFCKKEYEVVLLTDVYAEDEYPLPEDVKRICLADNNANKKRNRISATLYRLFAIRKACKKEKVKLAVAFMSSSGIRLEVATIFMGIKTAIAIRNNPMDELQDKKSRILLLSSLKSTDGVIFQMESQKELFDKKIQEKSVVIYNPANEQFCNTEFNGESKNKIVTVGRLFDYKNQGLLIDAFSDIRKKFPDMKLYIYGEGEYREELERQIISLGLEESAFLPGAASNVAEEIKDAKLFVLPSDTEGMPNTLIEAMLLGLPVISTDCPCGGPKALIRDGENGLLVPVRNKEALVKAMMQVLDNETFAKELGTKAKDIIKLSDRKVISRQWLDYIGKLL